jgi:hypothetical protein
VTEMLRRCRRRWRSTVIPLNIRIGVYGRQSWSATILRLWRRVVTAILLRRRRLISPVRQEVFRGPPISKSGHTCW